MENTSKVKERPISIRTQDHIRYLMWMYDISTESLKKIRKYLVPGLDVSVLDLLSDNEVEFVKACREKKNSLPRSRCLITQMIEKNSKEVESWEIVMKEAANYSQAAMKICFHIEHLELLSQRTNGDSLKFLKEFIDGDVHEKIYIASCDRFKHQFVALKDTDLPSERFLRIQAFGRKFMLDPLLSKIVSQNFIVNPYGPY